MDAQCSNCAALTACCVGHQDAEAGSYDAIIVDSSDPVGPASVLFTKVRCLCDDSSCRALTGIFACSHFSGTCTARCAPVASFALKASACGFTLT